MSVEAAVERPLEGAGFPATGGPAERQGHTGSRPRSVESVFQVVIMLAIGTAAAAGSFTHVHDVAAAHGQAGWLAWADAVVLELMSIASGLELRRRKRTHVSTRFPAAVMGVAVVLSLSAQVVEAEPSPIGWIAAIPALGFLVMVKIALARSVASTEDEVDVVDCLPAVVEGGDVTQPSEEADAVALVLVPAARAAAAALLGQGRRVTAKALGDVLRADGYAVTNARASAVLEELKPQLERQTPLAPVPGGQERSRQRLR